MVKYMVYSGDGKRLYGFNFIGQYICDNNNMNIVIMAIIKFNILSNITKCRK